MRIFGVRPYRRRGRKYGKSKAKRAFPNLPLTIMPSYASHVWATDFTELVYRGKKTYVSTIIDLFTRQLMGVHVGLRKGSALTMQTLANALFHHPRPMIFHSDNGSEYNDIYRNNGSLTKKTAKNSPNECLKEGVLCTNAREALVWGCITQKIR